MWNVRTKAALFTSKLRSQRRIITRHFFANCRCVRERAEQFSRGGGRLKTGVEIDVTAELCQSVEPGALLNGNF